MDLSFSEENETSGEEGYPGGRGLDEPNGVDPNFLTSENVDVSYLDCQYGDCGG
jgi:hypothetical protein